MKLAEAADVYRMAAEIVDRSPEKSMISFACNAIYYAQVSCLLDHWKIVQLDPLVCRFRDSILRPETVPAAWSWYRDHERPECPVIALLFMAELVEAGDA